MKSREIKKLAVEAGLCDKWAVKWTDKWSVEDMLEALSSLDGIEFFAKKNFPTISFILQHSKGKHEDYGIVLKRLHDKVLERGKLRYMFAGSKCKVIVPNGYVGFIYVVKRSDIELYLPQRHGVTLRYDYDSHIAIKSGKLRDKKLLNNRKDGI